MPLNGSEGIDFTKIDPGLVPKEQHLALLQWAASPQNDVTPLCIDWHMPKALRQWTLGDVVMTQFSGKASRFDRTQAHLRRVTTPCVGLRVIKSGRLSLELDERNFYRCDTGNVLLVDQSVPGVQIATDFETLHFGIPKARLRSSPPLGRKVPAIVWPRDSSAGEMLFQFLLSVEHTALASAKAEEANGLGDALIGMLDGLLASHPQLVRTQYANASRLTAMKAYIQQHLRDPRLGADGLCQAFDCSRATVYRLFEECNGVTRYIQRMRVQQCMHELTRAKCPNESFLEAVATAWHLGSADQVNQLFLEEFELDARAIMTAQQAYQRLPGLFRPAKDKQWQSAETVRMQGLLQQEPRG